MFLVSCTLFYLPIIYLEDKNLLKKYEEGVKRKDRIGIVSCNNCVRMCGTSGMKSMKKLSESWRKMAFDIKGNLHLVRKFE